MPNKLSWSCWKLKRNGDVQLCRCLKGTNFEGLEGQGLQQVYEIVRFEQLMPFPLRDLRQIKLEYAPKPY